MDEYQRFVQKRIEFNEKIASIIVEEFSKSDIGLDITEYEELEKQIQSIDLMGLQNEIRKQLESKKIKLFPDLLDVYYYPVIKEIDFLLDKEKLLLDKFLASFKEGEYLYGLQWKLNSSIKLESVENFLAEKGLVEIKYFCICPNCNGGDISSELTEAEKSDLLKFLKHTRDLNNDKKVENKLDIKCFGCDAEIRAYKYEEISEIRFRRVCKLVF